MALPLLDVADIAHLLAPTAYLHHSFVEHEDLKAILLAGQKHFNIQKVCDVRAGKGPELLRSNFPVITAAIGSRDPLVPAVGFFGGIMVWSASARRSFCISCGSCFSGWSGTSCCTASLKKFALSSCRS